MEALLKLPEEDPYASSPPFERLLGDLKGAVSRRINIHPGWSTRFSMKRRPSRSSGCGHTKSKNGSVGVVAAFLKAMFFILLGLSCR
ncbi:MAG: hypothetical protein KA108_05045, partial [Candidatus Fermentibacter sp.]|nr:hypothetical protein [Candidatus Fermentibacter sp.]